MSAPPAQPGPTHHPVCHRQQDTGELWAHAIDIFQAIGQPLPMLDSERMATLSSSLMAAVPLAMEYRGTAEPGRAARFVLTGPAGGTYTVPLAPQVQAAEPEVTIVADTVGLCHVAVRRLGQEQMDAAIVGDRALVTASLPVSASSPGTEHGPAPVS